MQQKFLKPILILILGILLGLWLSGMFSGSPAPPIPKSSVTVQPPQSYTAIEKKFTARIDSFDEANSILKVKIAETESALILAKRQNRELNKTVDNLLKVHYTVRDTVMKLENCDSLATACQELLSINIRKDSLCDSLTTSLQTQVCLRDSVIKTQEERFDTLHAEYHRSLVEKKGLLDQNANQQKEIRKHKRGKSLLTIIVGVLGALLSLNVLQK